MRNRAAGTLGLPRVGMRRPDPESLFGPNELRRALDGPRVHARYQPIVCMADGVPVGLEVLARLARADGGLLGASAFVPAVERAGLAWPLSRAVARRVIAEWPAWLAALPYWLAVNLPLDVLLRADVIGWLERGRALAGMPAERLVIELTESRPLTRLPELARVVSRLRRSGYGIAIDDVGPGPLLRDPAALLGLDFTMLKLDKGVVRQAPRSAAARQFLRQTIAAAHARGLAVVAEGVADAPTWALMVELGVQHAQGFHIARPLAAEAVAAWHGRRGAGP
jgi:EAL domain-containing protein (putative c-di-GMP-specific phosphodiesterase class I)